MCGGLARIIGEAGSYLRLIDSCITQLKAQGPSRTCNESEEQEAHWRLVCRDGGGVLFLFLLLLFDDV